jgi:hypothetical protein
MDFDHEAKVTDFWQAKVEVEEEEEQQKQL